MSGYQSQGSSGWARRGGIRSGGTLGIWAPGEVFVGKTARKGEEEGVREATGIFDASGGSPRPHVTAVKSCSG